MAWRQSRKFYTPTSLNTQRERDLMLGKLMLVVSEIAEASEAVRKKDVNNFKEEIADAFIRLMDITAATNTNIEAEIIKKMFINLHRPKRHGKKCSL